MTKLKDILYKVSINATFGDMERNVAGLAMDSRQVEQDYAFIAIKGTVVDGHEFIPQALENGAKAIICENLPENLEKDVTYVSVANSAMALGIMSSNFYGNPSSKLQVVAVTGTNGKTTVATVLFQLFKELGYHVGLLSTVHNKIDDEIIPTTHTTPDAIKINELLALMVKEKCQFCFMEASSHAIEQSRIAGLTIAGGIFTNISHEHLDYHKTFDAYIAAKKKLFDMLPSSAFALVNVDDKRGNVMLQNTKASKKTYAIKGMADYRAKIISDTIEGLELEIEGQSVWFRLIGEFNASNLMAAYGCSDLLGEDKEEVLKALSAIEGAAGRFTRVLPGHPITAIVDYAHSPDALQNVLETITKLRTGNEQVITVVGCGGNRDKTKRPLMADIACKFSDKVVFTSDNPRDEDPQVIIDEMKKGVTPADTRKTLSMVDREEAIKTACLLAQAGDIVLVAGKGHETYQEVRGVKRHFDDREVVTKILKMLEK
ncbi:MAG: UDP-N-acetylmuramoyl-L-alanyl-D-glutamate--2,6-diaminopimelate ligase [Candidatus Cyclobacteriaceae bacterium M2_1C_046]